MPRKITTRIDPKTLSGIHRLIWDHEHATTDKDRVKAARRVSQSFVDAGGCGWCWSENHVHATCGAIEMTTENQFG